jgi:hypothetical protein
MDSETHYFLQAGVREDDGDSSNPQPRSSKLSCLLVALIHLILILLYTAVSLVVIRSYSIFTQLTSGPPNGSPSLPNSLTLSTIPL